MGRCEGGGAEGAAAAASGGGQAGGGGGAPAHYGGGDAAEHGRGWLLCMYVSIDSLFGLLMEQYAAAAIIKEGAIFIGILLFVKFKSSC